MAVDLIAFQPFVDGHSFPQTSSTPLLHHPNTSSSYSHRQPCLQWLSQVAQCTYSFTFQDNEKVLIPKHKNFRQAVTQVPETPDRFVAIRESLYLVLVNLGPSILTYTYQFRKLTYSTTSLFLWMALVC